MVSKVQEVVDSSSSIQILFGAFADILAPSSLLHPLLEKTGKVKYEYTKLLHPLDHCTSSLARQISSTSSLFLP